MRDFSMQKYNVFLEALKKKGYPVYGVANWLKLSPKRGVLIRHDVDRKPYNSLQCAKMEAALGLSTTYYFRVVGSSYNTEVIKEISKLGHEIGYHYEDLALANGDWKRAEELFCSHLANLREMAPIATIAMHGRPFSKWNSLELFKKWDLKNFDLLGEAFLSVDYSGLYYFTDTGRSWAERSANLRDKVASLPFPDTIASTDSLLEFIASRDIQRMALVMHPERWDDDLIKWGVQLAQDQLINLAKGFIKKLRAV